MAWQVVDLIKFEGKINISRGALVIGNNQLPMSQIDTILVGQKCSFSAGLVHHASKFDVAIIFCDWKGEPVGAIQSWSDNTRVGARHRAQAAMTEPRKKNAWMQLIKAKIRSQASTLQRAGHLLVAKELFELAKTVRSGDPANLEAHCARKFWQTMYGNQGFTRVPGAQDSINALHNYGYTILRGRVLNAITAAGLSPSLGIFHRGRSNAFVLVDDLIEPFRAIIDRAVFSVPDITNATLDAENKRRLVETVYPDELIDSDSRPGPLIDQLAQNFARYVEGDTKTLKVPEV